MKQILRLDLIDYDVPVVGIVLEIRNTHPFNGTWRIVKDLGAEFKYECEACKLPLTKKRSEK